MVSDRLVSLYPLAGVRIAAGDLEMRWIDDELLVELAELAGRGVHADDAMPFNFPWTRGTSAAVGRRVLDYQWANRARAAGTDLRIEFAVLVDGRPVGVQGASSENWSVLREVETGSWLGREHQGAGTGNRMRALMLHFLFEGMAADFVTSAAFVDNAASNAVSRRTGYEFDGHLRVVREGVAATQNRFRMNRERWASVRSANQGLLGGEVRMSGVDAFVRSLESVE